MQHHLEMALKSGQMQPGGSETGEAGTYVMLVDAAAQKRDVAALQTYVPLAGAATARLGQKLFMAIAGRASGVAHTLAGDYAQARAELQHALELFTSCPAPWQIGRTLFEMGELACAESKTDQARGFYSQALHMFEELHAAPYAARARLALENLGHA